jgi:hypothetical protein
MLEKRTEDTVPHSPCSGHFQGSVEKSKATLLISKRRKNVLQWLEPSCAGSKLCQRNDLEGLIHHHRKSCIIVLERAKK